MWMTIGILSIIGFFIVAGFLGWIKFFLFALGLAAKSEEALSVNGKLAKKLRKKAIDTIDEPFNPTAGTYDIVADLTTLAKKKRLGVDEQHRLYKDAMFRVITARQQYPRANQQLFSEYAFWLIRPEEKTHYNPPGCVRPVEGAMHLLCWQHIEWSHQNNGALHRNLTVAMNNAKKRFQDGLIK